MTSRCCSWWCSRKRRTEASSGKSPQKNQEGNRRDGSLFVCPLPGGPEAAANAGARVGRRRSFPLEDGGRSVALGALARGARHGQAARLGPHGRRRRSVDMASGLVPCHGRRVQIFHGLFSCSLVSRWHSSGHEQGGMAHMRQFVRFFHVCKKQQQATGERCAEHGGQPGERLPGDARRTAVRAAGPCGFGGAS